MGNGQIGYDISPYEALDEIAKEKPKYAKLQNICSGLKTYLNHLEDNKKEVRNRLDNFYEDLKAVWKLTDKDEWIKSVKKEFKELKSLLS